MKLNELKPALGSTTAPRRLGRGVGSGLGYTLAIVLFSSIRERLDATSKCPKCFEGFPIALVSAALLAMSFMGFSGLSIW